MTDPEVVKQKLPCWNCEEGEQDSESESPQNNDKQICSADTLNDFCWLQIFNKLNIRDLCSVVNVNKQFHRLSMMSFSERYANFYYPNHLIKMRSYKSHMRRVLCNFGHLIRSLTLRDYEPGGMFSIFKHYPIEMDAISKYCAGTLVELKLKMFHNLDCDSAKPLFASLQVLDIEFFGRFTGDSNGLFKECGRLKILKINGVPRDEAVSEIAQQYPNLEGLYIHCDVLNQKTTLDLLKFNPQIKKLDTFSFEAYTTLCLMPDKLENLEEIILRCEIRDYDYMSQLWKLKSYQKLELRRINYKFIAAIEEVQDIPLESLKLFNCPINLDIIDNLLKLKSLKRLTLSSISSPFDAFLRKLGEQLPLLEKLKLEFRRREIPLFSTSGLERLIETSPKLYSLAIQTHHSTWFNQEFYDSLLNVIRKRSNNTKKFTLTVDGAAASTPLQMHINFLHLKFQRRDRNFSLQ